jgi:predicted phosphodiesterase
VRLDLFSDVHGNSIALGAVLADVARRGGTDAYWVLGHLVALGHDPVGVLERVSALPAVVIRGNTDRHVATGERPPPRAEDAARDPALAPVVAEVTGSFAWTVDRVTAAGGTGWLDRLPREARTTLPDGTRLLGVHASPQSDEGAGIRDDSSDADLEAVLAGGDADVVVAGHTHQAIDRMVGATRVINLGRVSNPRPRDLRASYVLVDADATSHRVEHVRVDSEHDAVGAALDALEHPRRSSLIAKQRGEAA